MPITFGHVAPTLFVNDVNRSLSFWQDQLGFEVIYTNGAPISFAIIRRDVSEIHLAVKPDFAGTSHCHIMVVDIEPLAERSMANDVKITQQLTKQPWGLSDMIIADPDGNTLEIAGQVAA
ncbi:Glyoxalase-like domain protein [Polystyrenella longa]|uniref:Glyoxalase-like domain protein n=1 Tax=Polystyrenella longa TaxID=2528007 RepID=A0A518CPJ1_9PLAN|nr:VOC family protein [Polystyrenella longa]QDU81133.1 Glyoxalase-like domain protein [Polystyrenella longa]